MSALEKGYNVTGVCPGMGVIVLSQQEIARGMWAVSESSASRHFVTFTLLVVTTSQTEKKLPRQLPPNYHHSHSE